MSFDTEFNQACETLLQLEAEVLKLKSELKAARKRMKAMEEILDVYVGHTCVADGKGGFIGAENCPAHRWEAMKANSSNFTPAT